MWHIFLLFFWFYGAGGLRHKHDIRKSWSLAGVGTKAYYAIATIFVCVH